MKRLTPRDGRVTILLPQRVLDEINRRTKGPGELNSWVLFALLKSLQDENFSWDLQQSKDFLDQQLEI
jgi:hypothetical protein